MSNYSYSPSISFGQFIPKDTLLHRLDPRIKVFLSLVVILSASLTLSFITLSIVFGFILIGAFVSKMTWRQIFKAIFKVLPYLFIISILQFLFAFTEDVRILFVLFDRIVISVEDLIHLGILLYRFFGSFNRDSIYHKFHVNLSIYKWLRTFISSFDVYKNSSF